MTDAEAWEIAWAARKVVAGAAKRLCRPGVELQDLFQEGLIAVHRAAPKYDLAFGWTFGKFAYRTAWWAMVDYRTKCGDVIRVTKEAGWDRIADPAKLPPARRRRAKAALRVLNVGSVDNPDIGRWLKARDTEDHVEQQDVLSVVFRERAPILTSCERTVLHQRYIEGLTLRAVAENLGYTHQGIRAIEQRALGKLRERLGVA